jgi:hypothetical protein
MTDSMPFSNSQRKLSAISLNNPYTPEFITSSVASQHPEDK